MARRIDMDLPGKRLVKSQKLHFRAEAPTLSFSKAKVQSGHLGGAPMCRGLKFPLGELKVRDFGSSFGNPGSSFG